MIGGGNGDKPIPPIEVKVFAEISVGLRGGVGVVFVVDAGGKVVGAENRRGRRAQ